MTLQDLLLNLRKLEGRHFLFILLSTLLLILTLFLTTTGPVFARGITDAYIQEIKDRFQRVSDSTPATEIFLAEKEPHLLTKQTVEEKLLQKAERSNTNMDSYIDTGFSRKSDNQSYTADRISDIKIHFYVHNDSNDRELVTINTGIKKGLLKYIRLEGATGYRWENDELVIAYIPLSPQGSAVVTLTAMPLISNEAVQIQTTPKVINENGQVVSQGAAESKSVRLDSSVDIKNINSAKRAN